ncbi:ribosome maturation factor RimP [Actinomycetospora endophytica]|uniref:Ribosome maturation factor RimP n=1 Tax=Actinomycetospora endophytica TaxID=2291215 RepID=A0ABS8PI70_9PSEU|nr:ribosome maturation factor RimP [Actinomycetospora endophytica]MCD2197195.1 ribosome maturation factor RimP [Actinomycetospora endophytica]
MSRAPVGSPTGAAASALQPVVDDVVARAGFVLDELDVRPAGRSLVVRVTVESSDVPGVDDGPTGGVDLDAVAELSREVSAAVDAREAEDPAVRSALSGSYTLEVTTPGTDRPLTEPRHWERAWLRRVAVTLTDGETLTGRVGGVGTQPATVTLAVGKDLRTVPLADVTRAAVEVEFKPAPEAEVEALRAARREAEQ